MDLLCRACPADEAVILRRQLTAVIALMMLVIPLVFAPFVQGELGQLVGIGYSLLLMLPIAYLGVSSTRHQLTIGIRGPLRGKGAVAVGLVTLVLVLAFVGLPPVVVRSHLGHVFYQISRQTFHMTWIQSLPPRWEVHYRHSTKGRG